MNSRARKTLPHSRKQYNDKKKEENLHLVEEDALSFSGSEITFGKSGKQ